MKNSKRIVITGIGPMASPGIGKKALWEGLLSKKTNVAVEESKIDEDNWEKFYVHKMQDFSIDSFGLNPDLLADLKRWIENRPATDLMYLLGAIKLAMDDAAVREPDKNRTGFVLTHENAGYEEFFLDVFNKTYEELHNNPGLSKKEFFLRLYEKTQKAAYDLHSFMPLFHASKIFDIHGYSLFLNNACASGLYAMETASQIIRSGLNDTMIIAAADYPRTFKYLWFKLGSLYSPDGIVRPFSKESKGLVFGDGAVGLVMEDLDHALKRNATIYCEYLGGGFTLEGWKVTLPSIQSDFFKHTVEQAIERTGIKKSDIDLICAHGVGSALTDRYEAKVISDIFGAAEKQPPVTAFKSYVGHTLGASALLETVITIMCMNNSRVLPSLHSDPVHPAITINLLNKELTGTIGTALKICSAFAGYDGAILLKKFH